jgi:hypothetical protein
MFSMIACTPSENPMSEDLIKTSIPQFSGGQSASFTTTTAAFTLYGDCDPISKGLEWSYDQKTWKPIDGGCNNGAFQLNIVVAKTKNVYVRATTKMGYTPAAVAFVRFVLPPTTAAFQVVSAGTAIESDEPGIQFTMSGTSTSTDMESPSARLDLHMTGLVYAD